MLYGLARRLSSFLMRILRLVDLFLPEKLSRRIFSAKIFFFENFVPRSAVMVAATKTGRRKGIETLERAPDDLFVANRITINIRRRRSQ